MMTYRRRAGLSLVELIVALCLMGTLLGFGALNSRSQGTVNSRAVAELLAEALRQAREEALSEGAATAIVVPSQGGSRPHSQAFYRLHGAQFPRITAVRRLDDEFPGTLLFVGHWPLAVGSNATSSPPLAGSRRLDFSAWQPPYAQDHHFIFTPQGEVITNALVHFDGAYHIVVCRGAEFTPEEVSPSQSFRATSLAQPVTVSISLMGDVSVSNGLPGAISGIAVPTAPWPVDAPAPAPVMSAVANTNPNIVDLEVSPIPYPPTLPAGVDATVDLKGYLTIRTRAADPNGGPLRCRWEVNGGSVSSAQETPMEWDGTEWTSVWEWRPPESAAVGDLFELRCTVKDPAGATAQQAFGAAGVVEVTGVGEILFDTSRDGNREIFAMNADGSNLVNLTNHPALDHMASWSPDGSRIAFVSDRLGGLQAVFVMHADGTGVKQVSLPSTYGVALPDWSPDGTRIIYSEDGTSPASATVIVNADGSGGQTVRTHTPEHFLRNSWHPNGNLICVNTYDGAIAPGFDIQLMGLDGVFIRNLTDSPGFDAMPRWSPDGNSLVWNSDRSGNHEIYVADFAGTALTTTPLNVSNSPDADLQPNWSPDSRKILFVRKDRNPMSGIGDIWVVDRDGANLRQLTTHASLDDFPSWRP